MGLLNGRLQLHDLRDTEALAWSAIRAHRLHLNPGERESLAAYLIAEVWRASLRYDPSRGSFATLAGTIAHRRVVDWLRLEFGRSSWQFHDHSYERERPVVVSLDTDEGRLAATLAKRESDREADRDPLFDGVLDEGDRATAWDYELLGLEAPRRAP